MTEEKKTDLQIKKRPLMETDLALRLVDKFGLPTQSLLAVIRHQIIAVPRDDPEPTDAEMALVLSTMAKYDLDPMVRQMSAWRDNKGKLCIMVEQPGWVAFANRQPGFLRVSYKYGEMIGSPDGKGKKCWEWVQATIHDSIRGDIEMPPVFLEEWYVSQRNNYEGNWQKYTKHRLPMKAHNMGIKQVYGFSVYDEIDHDQMVKETTYEDLTDQTQASVDRLTGTMAESRGADQVFDQDYAPAQDDPEELPDDFVPCSIAGCGHGAEGICDDCRCPLCPEHSQNGFCAICAQEN